MADITLGRPVGAFYWEGRVNGELCLCDVSWACSYDSTEDLAIPPLIRFLGKHVVVTNQLEPEVSIPMYVSPGVLTLTPTVTCKTSDPLAPDVTELSPIYLTITAEGASSSAPACVDTLCPFPANPGFESGLTDWAYSNVSIDTVTVYAGTNSAKLTSIGSYLSQEKAGMCPGVGSLGLSCKAYRSGTQGEIELTIVQYDGLNLLDTYMIPITILPNAWRSPAISREYHPGANTVHIRIEANDADIYIDDVYVDHCP